MLVVRLLVEKERLYVHSNHTLGYFILTLYVKLPQTLASRPLIVLNHVQYLRI